MQHISGLGKAGKVRVKRWEAGRAETQEKQEKHKAASRQLVSTFD